MTQKNIQVKTYAKPEFITMNIYYKVKTIITGTQFYSSLFININIFPIKSYAW